MTRDRLQLGLWSRGERLAMPPRLFDGGQEPEVALGVPHDPLLIGPLDKEGHHTRCSGCHLLLLWSSAVLSETVSLTCWPVLAWAGQHGCAGRNPAHRPPPGHGR